MTSSTVGTERNFTIVADLMENHPTSESIICTGDLLNFAPPPGTDPDNSLLFETRPTIRESYLQNDVQGILNAIRSNHDESTILEAAKRRYHQLLRNLDTFYFVMGNQDIPEVLTTVSSEYDHVNHVSHLSNVAGVDGVIPEVAGTPPGTFPCECSLDQFRETAKTATADVLIAHTLPETFRPEEYGFSVAICSTDRNRPIEQHERVLRLPAYPTTGVTAQLTLTNTTGNRSPQIELTTTREGIPPAKY